VSWVLNIASQISSQRAAWQPFNVQSAKKVSFAVMTFSSSKCTLSVFGVMRTTGFKRSSKDYLYLTWIFSLLSKPQRWPMMDLAVMKCFLQKAWWFARTLGWSASNYNVVPFSKFPRRLSCELFYHGTLSSHLCVSLKRKRFDFARKSWLVWYFRCLLRSHRSPRILYTMY